MKVPLYRIAHGRSGDKGQDSNVGLIAYDQACYELIRREVTPTRVKKHFRRIVRGKVERFEIPNLLAFNFLLHDSLGCGGSTRPSRRRTTRAAFSTPSVSSWRWERAPVRWWWSVGRASGRVPCPA